ncbi:FecR family protein [Mucilaginibacter limnophilus]|uniref:FecR family protein n=1 Tax=Mucilaginibacter limnophilus TaxID=1932778 RepID=A0A437MI62_9SPHI|nr:FecR family protein [Mucilaginibacter limnophilus]RVT97322.1 FecR family protein [Mucilaginibacter limnophilus]
MKPSISKKLLKRFLDGNCTTDERRAVLEWYNSFDAEKDALSTIYQENEIALREHIYQKVNHKIILSERTGKTANRKLLYIVLRGVAAMLIISLGITYFKIRPVFPSRSTPGPESVVIVSNKTNHIVARQLSDGSQVWLNPGAEIKFANRFRGTSRDVFMVGEAFFEVTKNSKMPFIVHSSNIITKVWGTSFRVRDSRAINFADVTVVTGKVSVKLNSSVVKHQQPKEFLLYPKDHVVFSKPKKTFIRDKPELVELKMWKRVDLSFNNTPLAQVVKTLNNRFSSKIELRTTDLEQYTINVNFTGLNLAEVITILCKTLNISYQLDGDKIIMEANKNN